MARIYESSISSAYKKEWHLVEFRMFLHLCIAKTIASPNYWPVTSQMLFVLHMLSRYFININIPNIDVLFHKHMCMHVCEKKSAQFYSWIIDVTSCQRYNQVYRAHAKYEKKTLWTAYKCEIIVFIALTLVFSGNLELFVIVIILAAAAATAIATNIEFSDNENTQQER